MNTSVTDWELTFILFASIFTIVIVLFIVSKWLNFHLIRCCINCIRKHKLPNRSSIINEQSITQEPSASYLDLGVINEALKNNHDSSLWTPAVGSSSSLITNDTTYDETSMPNSSSAYDIVSYAQNVKSTLKRTISCDSDNQSIVSLTNDFCLSDENVIMGKLQITINYNALEEYLEIVFLQIRDLTMLNGEDNEQAEFYLSAWLDEDREQTQRTESIPYEKHQTMILNSSMKWQVEDDHLPCTVLHTNVHTRDTKKIIGECSFTIGEIYIYQPLTTWLNLHKSDETCWSRGEISISLCYHPTADRLTCTLIQARNLTFHKRTSFNTDMISTDCYATISLLHRHQVRKKTRTSYHHVTDRNPVFNETSVFNVSTHDLLTSYIRIVIYEILSIPSSTNTKTLEIGHCLIGNQDRTQPTSHWQQMLRVLRRPVIVWHPLKL